MWARGARKSRPSDVCPMRMNLWMLMAGLSLFCTDVTLVAHHSFTGDSGVNTPIKVNGVVTKIEWTNPHPHVYVDVVDARGMVTKWTFQMTGNRSSLMQAGWSDKTLKVGDQVTIESLAARKDTPRGIAKSGSVVALSTISKSKDD